MSRKVSPEEKTHREIDESLKRAFEEILKEDLPDRFTQLLDELEKGAAEPAEKKKPLAKGESKSGEDG